MEYIVDRIKSNGKSMETICTFNYESEWFKQGFNMGHKKRERLG
jgi:hypothetical protein